MMPSGIMRLDKMPLNQNGKVDRKNLPPIETKIFYNEKMNATQKKIADIIKDEMQIDVDLHSNLFDLGLDSLSVIRLATCLQDKFEENIATTDIMKLANIYEIAKFLDAKKESKDIKNEIQEQGQKMTSAQKSIFMPYMKDTETTL